MLPASWTETLDKLADGRPPCTILMLGPVQKQLATDLLIWFLKKGAEVQIHANCDGSDCKELQTHPNFKCHGQGSANFLRAFNLKADLVICHSPNDATTLRLLASRMVLGKGTFVLMSLRLNRELLPLLSAGFTVRVQEPGAWVLEKIH